MTAESAAELKRSELTLRFCASVPEYPETPSVTFSAAAQVVTSDFVAEATSPTPPEPSLAAKFVIPAASVTVAQPPRMPLTLAEAVRMPFVESWVPVGRWKRTVPAVAARVNAPKVRTIFWEPPGVSLMVLKPPLARVVLATACAVSAEALPSRMRLPPPLSAKTPAALSLLVFSAA